MGLGGVGGDLFTRLIVSFLFFANVFLLRFVFLKVSVCKGFCFHDSGSARRNFRKKITNERSDVGFTCLISLKDG